MSSTVSPSSTLPTSPISPTSPIKPLSNLSLREQEIWAQAFERWKTELGKDNRVVKLTPTFEALEKYLVDTKKWYKDRVVPRLLERLDPCLSRLNSFAKVLDTYAQAHQVFLLLWGSMKLLIELASRFQTVLRSVVEMLENIATHLPRVQIYLTAFSDSKRIEMAVLELYSEIIGFCVQSIKFFRRHPVRNLVRTAWSSFESIFETSVKGIQKSKDAIELEAFAANIEGDIHRHEEIKSLLVENKANTESKIRLPCHTIQFPRNSRFFGRKDSLGYLDACLSSSNGVSHQRSIAVTGLGGMGKTELALEYAWQHLKDYQVILWVQADSLSKLEQGVLVFAKQLGLVGEQESSDLNQVIDLVRQWLERTDEQWLIVFDNVDDGDVLKKCWPATQTGSILVTAQNAAPSFSPAQSVYNLPPFSTEDGSELLYQIVGSHAANLLTQPLTDKDSALELSGQSGGLPLAITQIGAYILTVNCTLPEFVSIYDEQLKAGVNLRPVSVPVDFRYEHTMDTVWDIAFSKMDDQASFFLGVLAFLDPDSIPELLFEDGKSALDVGKVPLFPYSKSDYFMTLGKLCTYDMIKRNPKTAILSVHRLVQQALMQRMTKERCLLTLETVITLLSQVYPRQILGMAMDRFWKECGNFLPQLIKAASHYNRDDGVQPFSMSLVELLHNATWYMQERGMFKELLPLLTIGEDILRDLNEADSLLMGLLLNTRGNVYLEIGKLNECKDEFAQVCTIREKHYPPNDPEIANILENLSLAETALENYERATEISFKTLTLRESLADSQYADYKENTISTNYSNLCRILYMMGRWTEAEENGIQGVSLAEKAFGSISKNTAQAMFNLADVRVAQGHDQALHLHLKALQIRRQVLGNHYQTAGSCYKVAILLQSKQDWKNARHLLEDALHMYENAYSARGGVARTKFKLAEILKQEGLEEEADKAQAQAEDLRLELVGSALEADGTAAAYDILIPYVDR